MLNKTSILLKKDKRRPFSELYQYNVHAKRIGVILKHNCEPISQQYVEVNV